MVLVPLILAPSRYALAPYRDPDAIPARRIRRQVGLAGSSRVYVGAWDPKQVQSYDVLTTASAGSVSLGSVSGGLETTTWCGPNRVAIRSFSGSPNFVLVVAGLP